MKPFCYISHFEVLCQVRAVTDGSCFIYIQTLQQRQGAELGIFVFNIKLLLQCLCSLLEHQNSPLGSSWTPQLTFQG